MNPMAQAAVVGVFPDREKAERAMGALSAAGFQDEHLGILGRDDAPPHVNPAHRAGVAILGGAAAGGVAGTVLGLLAAGVIPGLGPVLAGGGLGAILIGTVAGTSTGGVAGGLLGMASHEETTLYYDQELDAGRWLVVAAADGRTQEAMEILLREGALEADPLTSRG